MTDDNERPIGDSAQQPNESESTVGVIVQAVVIGMLVMAAGTIPRNLLFVANLRYLPTVPWAVPLTAL